MPKILLLLISILLLPSGITRANVFGTDDRQELGGWLGDPQWFAVGRITYDGGYCTATLVGRNLIVTAKHCAFEYDGRWKTNLKFWPYTMHTWYRMGVSIRNAWKDDNHSWVLLSLTQPLGDYITPWLVDAYSTDNDESFGLRVSLFGYADDISNGQKLFMTMNCQFEFVRSPGVFGHYCDDYLGSAGAPIVRDNYDGFRIVAISTGFSGLTADRGIPEQPSRANLATSSYEFTDKWMELYQNVPFDTRNLLICNKLSSRESTAVSLTFQENNALVSRGHFVIEGNSCLEIYFGTADYPVYLFTSRGRIISSSNSSACSSFCWHPSEVFSTAEPNGRACPAGQELKCFQYIDHWRDNGRTGIVEIGD